MSIGSAVASGVFVVGEVSVRAGRSVQGRARLQAAQNDDGEKVSEEDNAGTTGAVGRLHNCVELVPYGVPDGGEREEGEHVEHVHNEYFKATAKLVERTAYRIQEAVLEADEHVIGREAEHGRCQHLAVHSRLAEQRNRQLTGHMCPHVPHALPDVRGYDDLYHFVVQELHHARHMFLHKHRKLNK